MDQFENFVRRRREMLANAINQLLSSLSDKQQIWVAAPAILLEKQCDTLEQRLRELIAQRLKEARGAGAWEMLVAANIRKSVEQLINK
ncbi:MAG: hypothetical protein J2P37_04745 [Ktedonobacteraceae bacterium]|nr:hypothetical protein [Ktedonobacteraceae bacterium]